jgi:uncharacterized protein YukE
LATRVLASEQARTTITQLQSVLNGGLQDQINQLNRLGTTLSDPNVWDGQVAVDFRNNVWPGVSRALTEMLSSLDELRSKIDQVTRNIMQAGGNA